MRSQRRRILGVAVVAAAMLGGGLEGVRPAAAHDVYQAGGVYVPDGLGFMRPRFTFRDATQCLGTMAEQKHTYRAVMTLSLGADCSTPFVHSIAGRIAHRGWHYKNGVICIQGGWQYTPKPEATLFWDIHEDLWQQCNNGWGNPVRISTDIESALWHEGCQCAIHRQARWANGTLPTTFHDH